MKAIILAAGRGNRLAPVTNHLPKALIPLKDGKTILDLQIENLSNFVSLKDILVVVGYKKELIQRAHPELIYVYNERYSVTNTSKSLLLGINGIEDDILWLNGDVVFDKEIIPKLLKAGQSCVLVDKKSCGEEEVKYSLDEEGYIKEISKEVKNAEGEALGINFVAKKDLPIFKKHLHLVEDNDYFEKAIENMIIQDGVKILPIDKGDLFCEEIDFIKDLEKVKNYLG